MFLRAMWVRRHTVVALGASEISMRCKVEMGTVQMDKSYEMAKTVLQIAPKDILVGVLRSQTGDGAPVDSVPVILDL